MTSLLRRLFGRRDVPVDVLIARTVFRVTAAWYFYHAEAATAFESTQRALDSEPDEGMNSVRGAFDATMRTTADARNGLRYIAMTALGTAATDGVIRNGSEFYIGIRDRVNDAVVTARQEASLREAVFNAAVQETLDVAVSLQKGTDIIGETGQNALSAHEAVYDAIFDVALVNAAIISSPSIVARDKAYGNQVHLMYRNVMGDAARKVSVPMAIAHDAAIEAVRVIDAVVASNDGGDFRDISVTKEAVRRARDAADKLAFSAHSAYGMCDAIARSNHKRLSTLVVPPVYGEDLVNAVDRLVESFKLG